jgi:hypothetical protein
MSIRSGWIKRIAVNGTLAILSLFLGFALSEGIVRLFFKDKINLYPRYHTDYRYGQYTLHGIRPNSEFWHTSVDGSWRLT